MTPEADTVGARIKRVRREVFRMSQGEFGDEVFRGESTISAYERDFRKTPPDFIEKLAKRLRVTPAHFEPGGPDPVEDAVYIPRSDVLVGRAIEVLETATLRLRTIQEELEGRPSAVVSAIERGASGILAAAAAVKKTRAH